MNQTSSPGKQRSWAPRTLPTQVASSSWTSSSHLTIPSSPLRSHSQRKFTIVTSTATAPSASTSSRISGRLPSQSRKYSSQSAPYSPMPTLMTLLCLKSQTSTRTTGNLTITLRASGLKDMPRELNVSLILLIEQNSVSSKSSCLCSKIRFRFIFDSKSLTFSKNEIFSLTYIYII